VLLDAARRSGRERCEKYDREGARNDETEHR
jgi:hypothetical protein